MGWLGCFWLLVCLADQVRGCLLSCQLLGAEEGSLSALVMLDAKLVIEKSFPHATDLGGLICCSNPYCVEEVKHPSPELGVPLRRINNFVSEGIVESGELHPRALYLGQIPFMAADRLWKCDLVVLQHWGCCVLHAIGEVEVVPVENIMFVGKFSIVEVQLHDSGVALAEFWVKIEGHGSGLVGHFSFSFIRSVFQLFDALLLLAHVLFE